MIIPRTASAKLMEMSATMPVVTVYGPRQSGKTTLVRHLFPDFAYANLEHPAVRDLAVRDPEAFFTRYPAPAIIDEVQRVPELLSYIQVKVDESGKNGQYILTGSHQPILRPFCGRRYPNRWRGGLRYSRCSRFRLMSWRRQAGRVGQLVNLESMSGDVGVSAHTLRKWLSVLEASYIVFRLQPYYANFGKRLVKTPKIYFTDVGLAAHLLGIGSGSQVLRDPLVGGLFENLVVAEAMKWRSNGRRAADFYFFRDSNGLEVDLVMENARRLHLLEVKCAMTPNPSLERAIGRVAAVTTALSKTIIYRGEGFPIAGGGEYVNFGNLASRLGRLADIRDA